MDDFFVGLDKGHLGAGVRFEGLDADLFEAGVGVAGGFIDLDSLADN